MSSGPTWITIIVIFLLLSTPVEIWAIAWIRRRTFSLRSLFLLTAVEAMLLGLIMVWFRQRG